MIVFEYQDSAIPLMPEMDCFYILPANRYLRVAGFPLNRILELKSPRCQKFLNRLAGSGLALWQPVIFENCFLVPGDLDRAPEGSVVSNIYRQIFSDLPQGSQVIIHPFGAVWGGSEARELAALHTLRNEFSLKVKFLLTSPRGIRFPNKFFNDLKRDLELGIKDGMTPDQARELILARSEINGQDGELVRYCLGC